MPDTIGLLVDARVGLVDLVSIGRGPVVGKVLVLDPLFVVEEGDVGKDEALPLDVSEGVEAGTEVGTEVGDVEESGRVVGEDPLLGALDTGVVEAEVLKVADWLEVVASEVVFE